MKYMKSGGFEKHPLMRLTLTWSAVFFLGLWVTGFFFYFTRMGLSPDSVVAHYLGSESEFMPARTFGSMLEVTHYHLAMIGVITLLLTHLAIFLPFGRRTKVWLIAVTFGSALLNEVSGWLVRFVNPGFAYLKIVSFITFQASFGFLLFALLVFLWRHPASRHPH